MNVMKGEVNRDRLDGPGTPSFVIFLPILYSTHKIQLPVFDRTHLNLNPPPPGLLHSGHRSVRSWTFLVGPWSDHQIADHLDHGSNIMFSVSEIETPTISPARIGYSYFVEK